MKTVTYRLKADQAKVASAKLTLSDGRVKRLSQKDLEAGVSTNDPAFIAALEAHHAFTAVPAPSPSTEGQKTEGKNS